MAIGQENTRGRRNEEVGEVVSNSMQKTISVRVVRMVKHPVYDKIQRRSTVFKAHDEKNEAQVGDRVLILETRPLSKTKRWKLVKIVEKSKVQEGVNV